MTTYYSLQGGAWAASAKIHAEDLVLHAMPNEVVDPDSSQSQQIQPVLHRSTRAQLTVAFVSRRQKVREMKVEQERCRAQGLGAMGTRLEALGITERHMALEVTCWHTEDSTGA